MHCQNKHAGRRIGLAHHPRRLYSVGLAVAEGDVHQNDVGGSFLDCLNQTIYAAGLADDLDVLFGPQQRLEAAAQYGMVVNYEHAYLARRRHLLHFQAAP